MVVGADDGVVLVAIDAAGFLLEANAKGALKGVPEEGQIVLGLALVVDDRRLQRLPEAGGFEQRGHRVTQLDEQLQIARRTAATGRKFGAEQCDFGLQNRQLTGECLSRS
jgi:hypothetical protein